MAEQTNFGLTLFFTDGVSLQTWDSVGMLTREVAIYEALQARGAAVRFVTYGDGNDRGFAQRLPEIDIVCNRWGLPKTWYKRWLLWQGPRAGAQVFKSNQVAGADLALAAARRHGAKFIARGGYLLSDIERQRHGEDSAEAQAAHQLESKIFRKADRAVVTTSAMQQRLIHDYGVPPEQVRVIPNYVLTDLFIPSNIPGRKKFRIGFVGRLDVEKNPILLLEAVAPLDVELVFIGDGPLRSEMEAQAAGAKARVSFAGNQPHDLLPDWLNRCDALVIPSSYEGHPKALIEAMSCGLAVIGTRVQGIQELIHDGETGLLCEPSVDSLQAALERLIEDEDLRLSLGEKARHYVEEHFSLDRVLELEWGLLNELVS